MSTVVTPLPQTASRPVQVLPGRRYDHLFFATMAWLMAVTVVVGFGPTYYFAGVFQAPLPSPIIHVHGALFSCWILLLLTQTSLVSAGRVDLHRRLGIGGFVLACCMPIVGVWAATDTLVRRGGPPGRDNLFFYIIPLSDMLVFATLTYFAFRSRRNSPVHKRLIYIATSGLLIAAIARWPWGFVHHRVPHASYTVYAFLGVLGLYDLWATRRLQRVTLWASAFLIFVYEIRMPIGRTAAWHSFAAWVQALAS